MKPDDILYDRPKFYEYRFIFMIYVQEYNVFQERLASQIDAES